MNSVRNPREFFYFINLEAIKLKQYGAADKRIDITVMYLQSIIQCTLFHPDIYRNKKIIDKSIPWSEVLYLQSAILNDV